MHALSTSTSPHLLISSLCFFLSTDCFMCCNVVSCFVRLASILFLSFLSACGYPFPSSQSFMIEEQTSIVHAIIPKLPTSPTFLSQLSIFHPSLSQIDFNQQESWGSWLNTSQYRNQKHFIDTMAETNHNANKGNHETINIFLGYKGKANRSHALRNAIMRRLLQKQPNVHCACHY